MFSGTKRTVAYRRGKILSFNYYYLRIDYLVLNNLISLHSFFYWFFFNFDKYSFFPSYSDFCTQIILILMNSKIIDKFDQKIEKNRFSSHFSIFNFWSISFIASFLANLFRLYSLIQSCFRRNSQYMRPRISHDVFWVHISLVSYGLTILNSKSALIPFLSVAIWKFIENTYCNTPLKIIEYRFKIKWISTFCVSE